MSDNVGYSPGSGATIGADEINGVLYQRLKLIHGDDGVNAGDVSVNNPLPVATKTGGIDDHLILLRRLFRLMEAQSSSDAAQRQRITLDNISAGVALPTVTTVATVSTVTAVTAITNALPAGTNTIGNVTIGGADQRQFIDQAKVAYAMNIRSRLTFS